LGVSDEVFVLLLGGWEVEVEVGVGEGVEVVGEAGGWFDDSDDFLVGAACD
jgi:hypothetical protein